MAYTGAFFSELKTGQMAGTEELGKMDYIQLVADD